MEWSQEQVIKLISLYDVNPVLWNQCLCPSIRTKTLNTLGLILLLTKKKLGKLEVQRKMKNLIILFQRYYKNKMGKSSKGAEDKKVKWSFTSPYCFLKHLLNPLLHSLFITECATVYFFFGGAGSKTTKNCVTYVINN